MRPPIKSITWRLQFWHAAILICVVAGLSSAWFFETRRARYSEIDAGLLSAARVLDGSLRGFRLPDVDAGGSQTIKLSPNDKRRLSLPRNFTEGQEKTAAVYFAIWLRDGRLLISERMPQLPPEETGVAQLGQDVSVRQREQFREVRIVGPAGTQILVGRDTSRDVESLNNLAVQIAAFSIGILVIGLIGGWWLSRAVLRPINAMSLAASRFSAADMSPRIDIVETDSELDELARILNKAFDRVESSFSQQQQFAADASHELRTPLAVIHSQIELALRKERTTDEYVKALVTCAEAEERLSELVESLLTLARLDSGGQPTERTAVRLDLIAAKCTDLMRPVAEHAAVELDASVEHATILGCPQQLEQAVLNLIKNGIAYTQPSGSVRLSLTTIDAVAELKIQDTGIGIGEEELAHVTKRFFRVDKARSRQEGGNGLGLSIVDRVVKTHHGKMQITSKLGIGTTVTLRFDLLST